MQINLLMMLQAVDDLLGHWCHDSHKPEQERVFNSLDKWKQQKDCREVATLTLLTARCHDICTDTCNKFA